MAAKGGFSIADLQQGAKKLQTAEAPPADCKGAKSSVAAVDNEALLSLGNPALSFQSVQDNFILLNALITVHRVAL